MVIHIVNGFEREKLKFLQFIHKTEQFCGSVLPRKNQIWRGLRRRPVENATERLLGVKPLGEARHARSMRARFRL